MGETTTTGDGLRVLRGPETLLDDPAGRLSHGGLLGTPAGLATVLVLERRPVPPPAGAAPAWLVHLSEPGRRDATLAERTPWARQRGAHHGQWVWCAPHCRSSQAGPGRRTVRSGRPAGPQRTGRRGYHARIL
ncbi:hypothetical protein [Kitasatospora purpeofusca]|uniref:hypothetical protein n=1 Tax=Kitasatospora purpeofusca TaxID=67352 RepID=UPI003800FE54